MSEWGETVNEQLEALGKQYPAWQIWAVHQYIGGTVFCARPMGKTRPVINENTARHLANRIGEIRQCED